MPGWEPIIFEEVAKGELSVNIGNTNNRHYVNADEIFTFHLNLVRKNITKHTSTFNNYGVASTFTTLIVIVVSNGHNKKVLINKDYLDMNSSHKPRINKRIKEMGLSVRKDIELVSNDIMEGFITPNIFSMEMSMPEFKKKASLCAINNVYEKIVANE